MAWEENGEQNRHIITRAPHQTYLKVPLALKHLDFLLVCGTGNERNKK